MNAWRNAAALAAVLGSSTAVAVSAQGVAKDPRCNIETGKPFQLKSAEIYLNKARSNGKPDEQKNHMRNTVRVLTEDAEKIGNPAGRALLLGQTLVWWAQQPNVPPVVKRADVGYTSQPNQTIDLYRAVDSAMVELERAAPQCAAEAEKWRRQLWTPAYNKTLTAMNANNLDEAEASLKLAESVWPATIRNQYFRASLAAKRNDNAAALAAYRTVTTTITPEMVRADTSLGRLRSSSMFNLAATMISQSNTLQGASRTAALKETGEVLRQFIEQYPNDANTPTAITMRARVLTQSGDSTAVGDVFAEMLANPSKYTDQVLAEAGTGALQANKNAEGAKLLEAALSQNPRHRDALYNLAVAYFKLKEFQKMRPVLDTLLRIDPGNPDNYRTMAAAYQGLAGATSDSKLKIALTDTQLVFVDRSRKMPYKVTVREFTHAGAKHTVNGSVEYRDIKDTVSVSGGGRGAARPAPAPAPAATGPATYTLTFEFLDRTGKVVGTQKVTVGPLNVGENKAFTASLTQAGVVSYRYTITQ